MANPWPNHYREPDHSCIPSMSDSDGADTTGQWQNPTQSDGNAAIQGCSCSSCSVPRHDQGTIEYQNSLTTDVATVSYMNQSPDIGGPTGMVPAMNDQTLARSVPQQALLNHENASASYAPPSDAASLLQADANPPHDQTQVFDMSVAESLRRVAGRHINNPESLVNEIRLVPSPSGRFRVVITVEIPDIF